MAETSGSQASASGSARHGGGGGSPFHLYKPGQGMYLRWGTGAGAGVFSLAGAAFLFDQFSRFGDVVRFLGPVIMLAGLAYLFFWVLGQNRKVVDFLIATEGEMKKVSWSSRREVIGATKVVIVTVLTLGLILFVVDILFMAFFEAIGVLRIGILERYIGGGGAG